MLKASETIPKEKLLGIIQHKMTIYQNEERDARQRRKQTKDHQKRLNFREQELISHGKTLAATEILTDIMGYARQIEEAC